MTSKISDLNKEKQIFQIQGTIVSKTNIRNYTSSTGRKGRLTSFVMKDDTGSIRITVFDNLIETLTASIEIGQIISFSNGYIKDGYYGGFDISANMSTVIRLLPSECAEKWTQIDSIKSTDTYVNLMCLIKLTQPISSITTRDGRITQKRHITLCDESGKAIDWIRWGEEADEEFQIGSAIKLKYARVQCYNGLQITSGKCERIEKHQKVKTIQQALKKFKGTEVENLSDAKSLFSDINIANVKRNGNKLIFSCSCFIQSIISVNKFPFCITCNRKSCGEKSVTCGSSTFENFVANLSLQDDSGTIRASMFKNTAMTIFSSNFANVDSDLEKLTGLQQNMKLLATIEDFRGNEYLKFKIISA
ncbi:hypothetical protein B4U80_13698 [Leptotrombidium deliense]|uniref:Uncharacterized protein n=1 Tax=Leptotrombidium deliense TaxID=299467 RepID=A0A443SK16_9ACAR|nr:hypothetical protein B4U80_13698 [Leptotrombidium deliense]